jgi:hypothetical protein
LYVECLEKRRAMLGDEHLGIITFIDNLVKLNESQG